MTVSDFEPGQKLYLLKRTVSSDADEVLFYSYSGVSEFGKTWFEGYDLATDTVGKFYTADYGTWSEFIEAQEHPSDTRDTKEVRMTSSTGGSKGSKMAKFSLIPEDSLWQLAESYGINLEKYPKSDIGLENWRYGYEWSLSYDAAERHLRQSLAGEKLDPDNNVNHLISCAWHCLALVHWMGREDLQHFDDRQSTIFKKYLEENAESSDD